MQEKDRDAVEEKQQEAASTLKGLRPLTWAGLFGPRFCVVKLLFVGAFVDVVKLLYLTWPMAKLFGITYLVGKIKIKLLFQGSLAK